MIGNKIYSDTINIVSGSRWILIMFPKKFKIAIDASDSSWGEESALKIYTSVKSKTRMLTFILKK